jgi:hypothetical protein
MSKNLSEKIVEDVLDRNRTKIQGLHIQREEYLRTLAVCKRIAAANLAAGAPANVAVEKESLHLLRAIEDIDANITAITGVAKQ